MAGSTYTCDLTGAGGNSECTVVTDLDTTYDYECFGYHDGTPFCCAEDDPVNGDIDTVVILGSNYDDLLSFSYAVGGSFNLSPAVSTLLAQAQGNDGDDVIHGSNESGTAYSDELWGESNADTIDGHAGDDYISGGDGNDILRGGDGDDTLAGGNDDDTMRGQAGADILEGGPGSDRISGGSGDDTIDGGVGLDYMCGDSGSADYIDDGDTYSDPEKAYGAESGDNILCGAGVSPYTETDSNSTLGGAGTCQAVLTTRPTQCPAP